MLRRPYHGFLLNTLAPRISLLVGSRQGLANGTIDDLHGGPDARVFFPPAPVEIELVALAGGEANTGTGTGVQIVRVWALGPNYEYNEIPVTMAGLTPVSVPGGPYLRCNFLQSDAVGSDEFTSGAPVIARVVSSGQELRRLTVGRNRSEDGAYTVPGDEIMRVAGILFTLEDQKPNDVVRPFAEFRLSPGSPWYGIDARRTLTENHPFVDFPLPLPFDIPPRADFRIAALASAAMVDMAARMTFIF